MPPIIPYRRQIAQNDAQIDTRLELRFSNPLPLNVPDKIRTCNLRLRRLISPTFASSAAARLYRDNLSHRPDLYTPIRIHEHAANPLTYGKYRPIGRQGAETTTASARSLRPELAPQRQGGTAMPPLAAAWESPHGEARLFCADAVEGLAALPPESVQAIVTSPPYWGLRDYDDPRQIGLEPTVDEYIERLRAVFDASRRVLREDGTLWLNLGDTYNTYNGGPGPATNLNARGYAKRPKLATKHSLRNPQLKPKDLNGIPWRVALALQADGWTLHSDCIWAKPNPMPESTRDRPTKAHEYVFLLSKSRHYFYDADAVREPAAAWKDGTAQYRNIRTVWTIPAQAYPGAHFATFPERLAEICILASTSAAGACRACGTGHKREIETQGGTTGHDQSRHARGDQFTKGASMVNNTAKAPYLRHTLRFAPQCRCPEAAPIPATVLDPFAGAGTSLAVALRQGRRAIGIETNRDYVELARRRLTAEMDAAALFRQREGDL